MYILHELHPMLGLTPSHDSVIGVIKLPDVGDFNEVKNANSTASAR